MPYQITVAWSPEDEAYVARVPALQPLINVSAIAKAAGLSVQTLSSKITRGTALTSRTAAKTAKKC